MNKAVFTPVPVMIAGIGVIGIKCLGLLLLLNEFGWGSLSDFLSHSYREWDSSLILAASVLLFFYEIGCGYSIIKGQNWARWGYIAAQGITIAYMLLAAMDWVSADMFIVEGETGIEILRELVLQKVPDVVVILFLFIPLSSRHFFARNYANE